MSDKPLLRRPRRLAERELAKARLELVSLDHVWLRRQPCGQQWSPNWRAGGRLPARRWQCHNECNAHAVR